MLNSEEDYILYRWILLHTEECLMKCAYCDNEGKMSREHVIPKGFIEHMNFKEQIVALDKAPTRVINSEITVKDVCATCNNGYLSVLDSYGLNLILKYNDKISVHTKKIQFKYNYDLLTRWLLKICYNMARANDGHYDISLYKKNVDYIMNRGEAESNIIVFAMFMGTGCLDEKMEEHCDHLKKNRKYDIDWFRIGQFRLQEDAIYYCASKFVIVNSFAFLTVVCDEEHTNELLKIRETISNSYDNFVELTSNGKVWLKRDDNFFMKSFETNAVLKDNYLNKRISKKDGKVKILTLAKDEIERGDFNQIECLCIEYMSNKDDLMDCFQSALIAIEGYQNENREPYQSRAFQKYCKTLFDKYPEIIWILNLDLDVITHEIMLQAYVNDNYTDDLNNNTTNIKVNKDRAMELLKRIYTAINTLTNKYAFDFSINQMLGSKEFLETL